MGGFRCARHRRIQEIIEGYDPTTDSGYGFSVTNIRPTPFGTRSSSAREIFRDRNVGKTDWSARCAEFLRVWRAALRTTLRGLAGHRRSCRVDVAKRLKRMHRRIMANAGRQCLPWRRRSLYLCHFRAPCPERLVLHPETFGFPQPLQV